MTERKTDEFHASEVTVEDIGASAGNVCDLALCLGCLSYEDISIIITRSMKPSVTGSQDL